MSPKDNPIVSYVLGVTCSLIRTYLVKLSYNMDGLN